MNEQTKNRYIKCLREMTRDSVLKDASNFIDLKNIEDKFPIETKEIREDLHIKYRGI